MTGKFRFGKISIGMRTRARIEHSATPITMTTTEIGLRSAERRSHMATALLVFCRGGTAGKAPGRLGQRQRKLDSAKPPSALKRHRFRLAPKSSVRQKHRQELQVQLDSVRVPGSPSCARLRVQEACSR